MKPHLSTLPFVTFRIGFRVRRGAVSRRLRGGAAICCGWFKAVTLTSLLQRNPKTSHEDNVIFTKFTLNSYLNSDSLFEHTINNFKAVELLYTCPVALQYCSKLKFGTATTV